MTLLRNLARRKLRTSLTVLGITIGIWALVVFSSMANKINTLVGSGSDYYVGKVIVSDGSNNGIGIGVVPIDLTLADQIRLLPDVAAVDPQVQMPFEAVDFAAFGMPKIIVGAVAGADGGLDEFIVAPAQGRLLTADDEGAQVVVLGSDLAREFGVARGRLDRSARRAIRGDRGPAADADRPGLDGDRAPGSGPGAVPRPPCRRSSAPRSRPAPSRPRSSCIPRRVPTPRRWRRASKPPRPT